MKKKIATIIATIIGILLIILCMYIFFKSNINDSSNNSEIQEITAKTGSGDFTVGSLDGANLTEMYSDGRDIYCAGHSWSLVIREFYMEGGAYLPDGKWNPSKELVKYTIERTPAIEQSIAYARWQGAKDGTLQRVVWASDQWKAYNESNLTAYKGETISIGGSIEGRAQQFANFQYKVLNNSNTINITTKPTDPKDLNIVVQQGDNASYTQGPYQISFAGSMSKTLHGEMTLGTLVWNEITNQNSGQSAANTFCKGRIFATVTYEDGSTVDKEIEVLRDSGASFGYNFPQFDTNFYVRVQTSTGEKRITKIQPRIKIDFMSKIKGYAYVFHSSEVTFEMTMDTALMITHGMKNGEILGKQYDEILNEGKHLFTLATERAKFGLTEGTTNIANLADGFKAKVSGFIESKLREAWGVSGVSVTEFEAISGLNLSGVFYKDAKVEVSYSNPTDATKEEDLYEDPTDPNKITGTRTLYKKTCTMTFTSSDGLSTSISGTSDWHSSEISAMSDAYSTMKNNYENWGITVFFAFRIDKLVIHSNALKLQPAVKFDYVTGGGWASITSSLSISTSSSEDGGGGGEVVTSGGFSIGSFTYKNINMFYGGNVWQEIGQDKTGIYTGVKDNSKYIDYSGIQVELWDASMSQKKAVTLTDSNGNYGFRDLNPIHKYYVVFTYDGMRYEASDYNDNLSGGYSTAQENTDERNGIIDTFTSIASSSESGDGTISNYAKNGYGKAYGLYTKIENSSGQYIKYATEAGVPNEYTFRYYDALKLFQECATNPTTRDNSSKYTMISTYESVYTKVPNTGYASIQGAFYAKLGGFGISDTEKNYIWKYIMDTLITSKTKEYPDRDRFVLDDIGVGTATTAKEKTLLGASIPYLYHSENDQSRHVDFGIKLRTVADLCIQKDVYSSTVLINGKEEIYDYRQYIKNENEDLTDTAGNWYVDMNLGIYHYENSSGQSVSDAELNSNNNYYNGNDTYKRAIRKSEYLFDANTTYGPGNDQKNLQMYVKYRIALKNQSQNIYESVDEVVDYYDKKQYEFDTSSSVVQNGTYVGNRNGDKLYDLKVNQNSIYADVTNGSSKHSVLSAANYNYDSLYITGIKNESGGETLSPGEITYLYITFEVNKDNAGKILINQEKKNNWESLQDTVGNRNIVEINGYSTYYTKDGKKAGVIDLDSNPGSLKIRDLDSDGDIITLKKKEITSDNAWQIRGEDDTAKAPNIGIFIDTNENRSISGTVFEDSRNINSNGALIGDGKNDRETAIDGVTVQLVELIRDVDAEGFATGAYKGEHIWSSTTYKQNTNGQWDGTQNSNGEIDYYSGMNDSVVIINSEGVLSTPVEYNLGNGVYKFNSVPPGDFFIRFKYGDTDKTVLTNDANNEVNKALIEGGVLSNTSIGLNKKNYTGQDYKSTVYQSYVTADGSDSDGLLDTVPSFTGVDQTNAKSYNGIFGYINPDYQNYTYKTEDGQYVLDTGNVNDSYNSIEYNAYKNKLMYIYDIAQCDSIDKNISDAKDVEYYRARSTNYSLGSPSTLSLPVAMVAGAGSGYGNALKNHRAEVLASGTKLITNAKASTQYEAINELKDNTSMVAQTGIINTEVEYNKNYVYDKTNGTSYSYDVTRVDLGLTERPEAQLIITKKVTNFKVILANGTTLFDSNKAVNNLIWQDHMTFTNEGVNGTVSAKTLEKNIYGRSSYRLTNGAYSKTEQMLLASMDEELMSGAKVIITYRISVENTGEIDYMDKQFYYKGITSSPTIENMSRTNATNVIDYVSNLLQYNKDMQDNIEYYHDSGSTVTYEGVNAWNPVSVTDLMGGNINQDADNDYVNNYYATTLGTYNYLLATTRLYGDLIPTEADPTSNKEYSSRDVNLYLNTTLSNANEDDSMIYNNFVEIIEIRNSQGRRMQNSISGNAKIAYQTLVKNAAPGELTTVSFVEPKEPDEDSAQKITISIPTGEDRRKTIIIISLLSGLIIITSSIIMIKEKLLKKK